MRSPSSACLIRLQIDTAPSHHALKATTPFIQLSDHKFHSELRYMFPGWFCNGVLVFGFPSKIIVQGAVHDIPRFVNTHAAFSCLQDYVRPIEANEPVIIQGQKMVEGVWLSALIRPAIRPQKQIDSRSVAAVAYSWGNPECENAVGGLSLSSIDSGKIHIGTLRRNE
jgi:hypothetical protein